MIGREADLVKEAVTGSTELEQLHFGGGTPTFLTNDELTLMMETLTKRFPLAQGGELSIEVDPRTCILVKFSFTCPPPRKSYAIWHKINTYPLDIHPQIRYIINVYLCL